MDAETESIFIKSKKHKYCECCNKDIPLNYLTLHKKTKKHINNMNEYNINNDKQASNKIIYKIINDIENKIKTLLQDNEDYTNKYNNFIENNNKLLINYTESIKILNEYS